MNGEAPVTTAEELRQRYGRSAPRPRLLWLLGAVASLALVLGIVWTVQQNLDAVDANGVGYQVIDEHTVQLSFMVTAPREREVICALEALDEVKGIVGWKIVHLPASAEHTRIFTERIPTVAAATTVLVNSCWAG